MLCIVRSVLQQSNLLCFKDQFIELLIGIKPLTKVESLSLLFGVVFDNKFPPSKCVSSLFICAVLSNKFL